MTDRFNALAALVTVSLSFGLLGLFGPAVAAIIVARVCDGPAGVSALLSKVRLWRVSPIWYVVVFALPLAVSGVVALAARSLWLASGIEWTRIGPINLVIFVLVVGEEIGWRGFALPRMIEKFGVGYWNSTEKPGRNRDRHGSRRCHGIADRDPGARATVTRSREEGAAKAGDADRRGAYAGEHDLPQM